MQMNPSQSVCFIRKRLCAYTPEEAVRQRLLRVLCLQKGFPAASCSVEASLKSVASQPSTRSDRIPDRRIDVLFSRYDQNNQIFLPFFLIECKAECGVECNPRQASDLFFSSAMRQLSGYRYYMPSLSFFALAYEDQVAIWSAYCDMKEPLFLGSVYESPDWGAFSNLNAE